MDRQEYKEKLQNWLIVARFKVEDLASEHSLNDLNFWLMIVDKRTKAARLLKSAINMKKGLTQ